jgi:hypothetical protein
LFAHKRKKKMKKLLIVLALTGCATTNPGGYNVPPPAQKLIVDKEVHAMTRLETANAIQDCQAARTRAVVIYGRRAVGGVTRDVVIDVTCAPLY